MIVHNFDPVLVDFGFLQINWYSMSYIIGIILGWMYAIKIIKKIQHNTQNFEPIKRRLSDIKFIIFQLPLIKEGVDC